MGVFSTGSKILSRFQGGSAHRRPPLEKYYGYLLAVLIGYALADLAILEFRPAMLPQEAPPARSRRQEGPVQLTRNDLESITVRNIFSDEGKIPPALTAKDQEGGGEGPAVPSQLPLKLMGTIVHINPEKSVASIEISTANKNASFIVGDTIENLARITKIERRRATFQNLNNNRLEYIEIPEDAMISFGLKNKEPQGGAGSEVQKRGENEFVVKRADLDRYTTDLSSILRQARMVPNIVPGGGGTVEGFRFVSIEPGSIFEKLGFRPGDVIKSVNGEPVNSPTKAMEMYQTLRSENSLALGVERDGAGQDFRYQIE